MNEDTNKFVRVPSNIDFDKLFDRVKGNRTKIRFLKDGMVYILSLLVVDNYTLFSKDGYRRLNNKILSEIIGDKRPEQIIRILIDKGVIEIKPYSKGHFSRGYRLTDDYNIGQFKYVELSERIENKLKNQRIKNGTDERDLENELFFILKQFEKNDISFDNSNVEKFLKTLGIELFQKSIKLNENQRGFTLKSIFNYIGKMKCLIEDINEKRFMLGFSQSNHRFNSNITSLPKILRPFLRINGCIIGEIDINSSQPFILSTILNPQFTLTETEGYNTKTIYGDLYKTLESLKPFIPSHKPGNTYYELGVWMTEKERIGLEEFTQFDFSQDFYQHILDKGYNEFPKFIKSKKGFKEGRSFIKKYIMYFLFERSDDVREENDVVGLLKMIYPDLCNYVERFIQTHGSRDFSILLQRTESYLMLRNVCKTINEDYPQVPFYTIHDSIITIDSYLDIIKEVLTDIILKITGKSVKVKIQKYEQQPELKPPIVDEIWEDLRILSREKYEKIRPFLLTKNINKGLSILPMSEQVFWKGIMETEIDKVLKG